MSKGGTRHADRISLLHIYNKDNLQEDFLKHFMQIFSGLYKKHFGHFLNVG